MPKHFTTQRVRYILPRDIHTLFTASEKGTEKVTDLHGEDRNGPVTFCNIIETTKTSYGEARYKIRILKANGEVKEGWCPGGGLDPVIFDPDNELLDGRFNF